MDARGVTYTLGFTGIKRIGTAQFYLMANKDKDGTAFNGASTYRLTVPANAPVKQYWSVAVYDRETHALIRNMPRASMASINPEIQKSADGSIDVYFGPNAPAGKEANWVRRRGDFIPGRWGYAVQGAEGRGVGRRLSRPVGCGLAGPHQAGDG